ncbi:MAG TPA: thioesterase [Anaerolineae bacterium]|nr:thioesterase [Anaerolineae bacterium]HOR00119.1 thioesterase [Anaerolineae bacterium]HPL30123.1 thioesterase [Anaerolineae bacterium]
MDIWTETVTVKAFEADVNRRWKPACFFQAMQQAATEHAASWGYDYDSLLAAGRVWILSRLKIRFDDLPAEGEAVTIRTWPKGIRRRVFFARDFEFRGANGRRLAAATSAWLLMDPVARRLLSPQALEHAVPDNDGLAALAEPLDKLVVPDDLPERLVVHAGYSAVDMLGHVNNARYVEWACDSLPFALFRNGRLRWLQVNYQAEVRPGERVSVRAAGRDGAWCICGVNLDSGRRAFEAEATFQVRGESPA